MKISSRFSIAVHIVLIIAIVSENQKITSSYLSECINVNPVIIRKILGQLKKAGLIDIKSGKGGATLLKLPNEMTLLDIYQATEVAEEIFNSHNKQETKCPVNCSVCPFVLNKKVKPGPADSYCVIHQAVDERLLDAQKAMEESLKKMTIQQIINKMLDGSNPKD